jgi:hypothetical protein
MDRGYVPNVASAQIRFDWLSMKNARILGGRKMQHVDQVQVNVRSDIKNCEREWREFFKVNCKALFQTALLLTADALAAETALAKSIEELDTCSSPGRTSLAAWKKAVVTRSIEAAQLSSCSAPDPLTRSILQPGLQPVIEIERCPRICFVLRMLLGYTTGLCAQILGMEESGIRMLFQTAVIQLQQKIAANEVQT